MKYSNRKKLEKLYQLIIGILGIFSLASCVALTHWRAFYLFPSIIISTVYLSFEPAVQHVSSAWIELIIKLMEAEIIKH